MKIKAVIAATMIALGIGAASAEACWDYPTQDEAYLKIYNFTHGQSMVIPDGCSNAGTRSKKCWVNTWDCTDTGRPTGCTSAPYTFIVTKLNCTPQFDIVFRAGWS